MKKAIMLIAIMFMVASCGQGYSDGSRSGVISKFSKKGLFVKSWEGEMPMGGMIPNGDGGMVANVFKFTVKDESLVDKINSKMQSGERVTLTYSQWLFSNPFTMGTTYEIIEVK